MRVQGQVRQGEQGETQQRDGSCGECGWQFEQGYGGQNRQRKGAEDLSSAYGDCRARFCEPPYFEGPESFYPKREDQSQHPMVAVLHGSQYRKNPQQRVEVCIHLGGRRKGETGISHKMR